MRDDKTDLRDRLWVTLAGCGGGVVGGSERVITGTGDLNWWTYRRVLAEIKKDAKTSRWLGEPGLGEHVPSLWVHVVNGPSVGAEVVPSGWSKVSTVSNDSGQDVWAIYSVKSDLECR